jgi:hypothetical protein
VDTLNRAGKTPLPNPLRKMHITGCEMHQQRPEQQMPHRRRIFETEEFSRLSVLTQTRLGFSTSHDAFPGRIFGQKCRSANGLFVTKKAISNGWPGVNQRTWRHC